MYTYNIYIYTYLHICICVYICVYTSPEFSKLPQNLLVEVALNITVQG